MSGFIPHLFVLSFCISTYAVRAQVTQIDTGHIGLDVIVARDSKFLVVDYVAAKGPADIAGIKKGDELAAINGVPTQGMSLATAWKSIVGDIGSVVKLSISHQGSAVEEVSIVRRSLLDAYLPAAMAGDPKAEYDVGTFYYRGPTATRNPASGADWYRKAADQGNALAEVALGQLYGRGVGVSKDLTAGIAWDLKAAKQGLAAAERVIGLCYLDGVGFGQSDKDAFAWLYSAAVQDDPIAEYNLGRLYQRGRGVAQNFRDAFNWYYRSAQNNNRDGARWLAYLYMDGIGVGQSSRDAFAWFYTAAAQDEPIAEENLAYLYLHGRGAAENDRDAFNWYYRSAQNNNPNGERGLAYMYLEGTGVGQSNRDAFAWLYSAAMQDDPAAEEYLARLYLHGRGVAQNDRDAFNWYYRSAENNDSYGAWGLAYVYSKGLGVNANVQEALKWYQITEADFPQDEALKKTVAGLSLKAFLNSRESGALDISLIMSAFRRPILVIFGILALVYLAGGIVLFYFSLSPPDVPPRLSVALGWVIFYLESQGVALLAIFIFGKSLTAGTLIFATAMFSALPVITSSCGPNRSGIWKASRDSWRNLLLYGGGAFLAIFVIFLGYNKMFAVATHSSLPLQPTQVLISKAKHASAWDTYACVALIVPAAEELIFRYYLFNALRRRFPGKVVVVITAFAFSLIHFQWLYFAPLFGFGLVLGWLRLKTDSLRLPLFLHALNNSIFLAFAV
jgi:TPR repeat protein/membrane protease YdiL (CAAX protease family)